MKRFFKFLFFVGLACMLPTSCNEDKEIYVTLDTTADIAKNFGYSYIGIGDISVDDGDESGKLSVSVKPGNDSISIRLLIFSAKDWPFGENVDISAKTKIEGQNKQKTYIVDEIEDSINNIECKISFTGTVNEDIMTADLTLKTAEHTYRILASELKKQ